MSFMATAIWVFFHTLGAGSVNESPCINFCKAQSSNALILAALALASSCCCRNRSYQIGVFRSNCKYSDTSAHLGLSHSLLLLSKLKRGHQSSHTCKTTFQTQ